MERNRRAFLTAAAATTAAQDPFPEAAGKAPLQKVCSNCHTAESVIQTLRTRQEWSDVIDQMSRFGAEASDKELAAVPVATKKTFTSRSNSFDSFFST